MTVLPCLPFDCITRKTHSRMISTGFDCLNVEMSSKLLKRIELAAVSLHYLDVDVMLAVLDGVDVSIEDRVLTGSSRPAISRAQHLKKRNTFTGHHISKGNILVCFAFITLISATITVLKVFLNLKALDLCNTKYS